MNSVNEVFLIGTARQVGKRQYGDGVTMNFSAESAYAEWLLYSGYVDNCAIPDDDKDDSQSRYKPVVGRFQPDIASTFAGPE